MASEHTRSSWTQQPSARPTRTPRPSGRLPSKRKVTGACEAVGAPSPGPAAECKMVAPPCRGTEQPRPPDEGKRVRRTEASTCAKLQGHPNSEPTEVQNQEKQEHQALGAAVDVSSQDVRKQCRRGHALTGHEGPQALWGRQQSLHTDEFSTARKHGRPPSTAPNVKTLHEARFKEMESTDPYTGRKKKHFDHHNLRGELKQPPVVLRESW